jgi:hypothetical protein
MEQPQAISVAAEYLAQKNALTKTLCVFFCSKPLNLECFFYRAVINETNLQQYKLKEQGGNSL